MSILREDTWRERGAEMEDVTQEVFHFMKQARWTLKPGGRGKML